MPVASRQKTPYSLVSSVYGYAAEWPAVETFSSGKAPVKLSILMAAYNEERTIIRAIEEVLETNYPCEIELIVVDDGSTDNTPKLLAQIADPRVTIYSHVTNMGKGAALRSAAALATGTHMLPFDADLEYAPEDIPRLLQPVLSGRCSIVFGARLFGFYTVYQSYRYAAGNRVLTRIANILFDARLSDLHTCLKLLPLPMFRSLDLKERGFGLDTEITAWLLKYGARPFEVPVCYYSRSHAQGKKIHWHDAVACLWILLRIRLSSRSHINPTVDVSEGYDPQCPVGKSEMHMSEYAKEPMDDNANISIAATG
jgi:dolichol-phosphate hexosyltransferase